MLPLLLEATGHFWLELFCTWGYVVHDNWKCGFLIYKQKHMDLHGNSEALVFDSCYLEVQLYIYLIDFHTFLIFIFSFIGSEDAHFVDDENCTWSDFLCNDQLIWFENPPS